MHIEQETQAALFLDSWKRLSWVEDQIGRVRELAEPWTQLPRHALLNARIDEETVRQGHIGFTVMVERQPELPSAINFLIGNIVTDARSCLDMAIDAIWQHYKLERRGIQVQFPLEDNFQEKRDDNRKGIGLRRFLERLDDRFVEVIENAQPSYADGLLDIPMNLSAIFISKLSNANKHRNITPVVTRSVLSSAGTDEPGITLKTIDDDTRRGIPPLRFTLEYDSELYSAGDARKWIAALENPGSGPLIINIDQRLVIARQEIPLYPTGFESRRIVWRADLADLLSKVPAYTRLTLRNLNRVHQIIEEDQDCFYMLDADGTL